MKRALKTTAWAGLVLVLGIGLMASSCDEGKESAEAQEKEAASRKFTGEVNEGATPVETLIVNPGPVEDTFWAPGVVNAEEEITLSAEAAGRITKLDLEVGDEVNAGDLVVSLDDATLVARIKQVDAQITRGETMLESSKRIYDRQQKLFEAKAGSEQALDDARQMVDTIQAELRATRAELEAAQVDLRKFRIKTPIKGAISEKHASIGEFASPGTPLYTVVTNDRVEFIFSLSETDVSKIKVGDPIEVLVDAKPDQPVVGKIKAISPSGNLQTRTFKVWAVIDNPEPHPLMPGMSGRARVTRSRFENVYLIPEEAIVREEGHTRVYLAAGEKAEPAEIVVSGAIGAQAVVSGGLTGTAEVLILGQHALSGERLIRVRKQHDTPPQLIFD